GAVPRLFSFGGGAFPPLFFRRGVTATASLKNSANDILNKVIKTLPPRESGLSTWKHFHNVPTICVETCTSAGHVIAKEGQVFNHRSHIRPIAFARKPRRFVNDIGHRNCPPAHVLQKGQIISRDTRVGFPNSFDNIGWNRAQPCFPVSEYDRSNT